MEKKIRKKLLIETCIIIGDARLIDDGKKPIRNKFKLSKELSKKLKKPLRGIHSRINRYEKDGFYIEDKVFVAKICGVLKVSKDELVTEY